MNSLQAMNEMKSKARNTCDFTIIDMLVSVYNRSRSMMENDMLSLFNEYQEHGTLSFCKYNI